MTDSADLVAAVCDYSNTKFQDSFALIQKCLNLLTLEQIWHRPNDVSNAIGNLVIHLNGNVRLWVIASLGGEPFERDRPAEFAQRDPIPTERILGELAETIDRARQVIGGLTAEQLTARQTIQGYEVTGAAAVIHALEHFSLHTGQIVYATKLVTGRDLTLYDSQGRRLDARDSGVP